MAVTSRELARAVERLQALPLVAEADRLVSGWLEPVLADPRVKRTFDLLNGRWLGHPLHPALSDLPIGLWSATALLDLLGARLAATFTSAAGTAAAVAAAASGIVDWKDTVDRERRLGLLHGLLNTAALSINLVSLGARLAGRGRTGRRLSFLGLATATGAAWLGGELVFGRGLGVKHTVFETGPDKWTPALPAAELGEGDTRCAEVGGRSVLLHRWQGRVSAIAATCTHAGGPLCEGEVTEGVVTCPWHGSRFSLRDGSTRRGPAVFPQPELDTRVYQGKIQVRARGDA